MRQTTAQTVATEQDRTLLVDALRLAADQYDKDQLVCVESGATRTAEQFARQALHARQLAAQLEDADSIGWYPLA